MTSNQFLTFQKFSNKEDALVLKESLEKGDIAVYIEDTSASVDITFAGNTHGNEFLLKVKQSEFDQANEILEKQAESIVEQFPADHYLFGFSDEELFELIEKSDEWSKEDYVLALRILDERGCDVGKEKIEKIKKNRLTELRNPEKGNPTILVVGYITAIVGGLLGFFIGWSLWKSTKLDPMGNWYYVYDEKTRKTGKTIFMIGVAVTIIWVIVGVVRK